MSCSIYIHGIFSRFYVDRCAEIGDPRTVHTWFILWCILYSTVALPTFLFNFNPDQSATDLLSLSSKFCHVENSQLSFGHTGRWTAILWRTTEWRVRWGCNSCYYEHQVTFCYKRRCNLSHAIYRQICRKIFSTAWHISKFALFGPSFETSLFKCWWLYHIATSSSDNFVIISSTVITVVDAFRVKKCNVESGLFARAIFAAVHFKYYFRLLTDVIEW